MKRKLLSILTLTLLVNANAFALEITKGHLISHKEWTTGGAKAIFKISKTKQIQTKNFSYVSSAAEASVLPQTGFVGQIIQPTSYHNARIQNLSDKSNTYLYVYSLCVQVKQTTQCAYYQDEFQLEPNGYAESADVVPELQIIISEPGKYNLYAHTNLNKERDGGVVGNTSQDAQSEDVLTVTDSIHKRG